MWLVTFSFPKDSNPLTHFGNFKPHEQNLEDVLVSVVCHASKTQPQHWVEQWAVSSFQHTVFVGQSLLRLFLRLAVPYKTLTSFSVLSLSSGQMNSPSFPRETQQPENSIHQQEIANNTLLTLSVCVHVCVLCLLMHHFPHFGHCLCFPPPGKVTHYCEIVCSCSGVQKWSSESKHGHSLESAVSNTFYSTCSCCPSGLSHSSKALPFTSKFTLNRGACVNQNG